MKKCPYCAEEIQDEAIKCRYCGEFLETPETENNQELFNVILHNCGSRKIDVIKILRETLNVGLIEAKDIAENPGVIQNSLSKANADDIKQKLEAAGAHIEVVLENSFVSSLENSDSDVLKPSQISEKRYEYNPKSQKLAIFSVIFIIIFVILCIYSGTNSEKSAAVKPTRSPTKFNAWFMCKKSVTDELKAPSTAKFIGYEENNVHEMSNAEFQVKGAVDSENSFGAMIRTNYTCTVRYDGDDYWTLTELEYE